MPVKSTVLSAVEKTIVIPNEKANDRFERATTTSNVKAKVLDHNENNESLILYSDTDLKKYEDTGSTQSDKFNPLDNLHPQAPAADMSNLPAEANTAIEACRQHFMGLQLNIPAGAYVPNRLEVGDVSFKKGFGDMYHVSGTSFWTDISGSIKTWRGFYCKYSIRTGNTEFKIN